MTQIGFGPLERVDGPPPVPPMYGLLQAAAAPAAGVRIVIDGDDGQFDMKDVGAGRSMDEYIAELKANGSLPARAGMERWINGVEVYPYPPDVADVHDPCASLSSSARDKGFGTDVKHPQFGAMTLWLAETCTSSHVWDQQQFIARAVAVLAAVESAGVAKELAGGVRLPAQPHFADGKGVFPNGDTATTVQNGLAYLEQAIGRTGRLGLVHVSPQIATAFREHFSVDNKTGVIRTINGNVVIPDAGYADMPSPNGHAAAAGTQEWMYATGPIDIRRSEIFTVPETVAEALDRGLDATNGKANAITYIVERYVSAVWDTELQAAVRVDRCATTC